MKSSARIKKKFYYFYTSIFGILEYNFQPVRMIFQTIKMRFFVILYVRYSVTYLMNGARLEIAKKQDN